MTLSLSLRTSKYGVFSFIDTGAPKASSIKTGDYTTVVILHGYVVHSAIFTRLAEYTRKYNTRLVLINRRGYPDSDPYTDEEVGALSSDSEAHSTANAKLQTFMTCRALEIYGFLCLFSKNERIPSYSASENTGGIVLIGWSLGAAFVIGFLANLQNIPFSISNGVHLKEYLRRVVLYDAIYHVLGYPPPPVPSFFEPIFDPADANRTTEENIAIFASYALAYYNHGTVSLISELRMGGILDADVLRRPTVLSMSEAEQIEYIHISEGSLEGSDRNLLVNGVQCGLFDSLKRKALYLYGATTCLPNDAGSNGIDLNNANISMYENGLAEGDQESITDEWPNLEIVHLWCDQTIWQVPYGMLKLKSEIAAAKDAGKAMRNIRFVRLRGANHFAHWDAPEQTLKAFLSKSSDLEFVCGTL